MDNISFKLLGKAKINDQKSIVISKYVDGSYTIATQLDIMESGNQISLFLKGSMKIQDVDGLKVLRDCIDSVIAKES